MKIDACFTFDKYEELWSHFRDRIAGKAALTSDCLNFGDWQGKVFTANSAEDLKSYSISKWSLYRPEFPQTILYLKNGLHESYERYVPSLNEMFSFEICKAKDAQFYTIESRHDGYFSSLPSRECGQEPIPGLPESTPQAVKEIPEELNDFPNSYWDFKKASLVFGLSSVTLGCAVASAMVCKQLFKRQAAREAIKDTITLITLVASGLTSGYFAFQVYSNNA